MTATVTMPEAVRIKRHADRAVPDEAAAILAQGLVAHVGVNDEGEPTIIPFSYQYDPSVPDRLYLHGAVANNMLNLLANDAPICISVTLVDGLVYSKYEPNHSMNYRSVVCYGRGRVIRDNAEKMAIFEAMVSRYFAGRTMNRDYFPASGKDLHTTTVIAVTIERWGAKARRGGPMGPDDADPDMPGTAGVVVMNGE